MWNTDYIIKGNNICVWEICYIFCNSTVINSLLEVGSVYKTSSCEVKKSCSFFCNIKKLLIEHSLCAVIKGNVNCYVIASGYKFFLCPRSLDFA